MKPYVELGVLGGHRIATITRRTAQRVNGRDDCVSCLTDIIDGWSIDGVHYCDWCFRRKFPKYWEICCDPELRKKHGLIEDLGIY